MNPTPPDQPEDAALRQHLAQLEVPKMVVWIDKEMKVETTQLTDKTINEILQLFHEHERKMSTNVNFKPEFISEELQATQPPAADTTKQGEGE